MRASLYGSFRQVDFEGLIVESIRAVAGKSSQQPAATILDAMGFALWQGLPTKHLNNLLSSFVAPSKI